MGTSEEKATAAGYDRWAPFYDDQDPSTWLDEPFLLRHLQPHSGCRILDLGCGTGRYLRRLRASMCRIVGVDLSSKMLAQARQGTAHRTDVRLIQASVTFLPFHQDSFDRVISGLVIDHVPSPEHLFQEVARVLKAAGRAVVSAVHPDMQRITGCDIEIAADDQATIRIPGRLHEVEDLLTAARRAGLTVMAKEEPPVSPAMVERRPGWKRKLGCPALVLLALAKQEKPA